MIMRINKGKDDEEEDNKDRGMSKERKKDQCNKTKLLMQPQLLHLCLLAPLQQTLFSLPVPPHLHLQVYPKH
jgi:hypothetical protein